MGVDAEMFVRTKEHVTPEQVRSWAYHLGASFGPDRFWIWHEDKRHCLMLVDEYEQDGDTIYPEEGETFIRVFPATRYYGKGYERGDISFLIMLAEWLERVIPGAEVWYGGDSSGCCASKFDKPERERMMAYFCEVAHHPYNRGFSYIFRNSAPPLCPLCDVNLIENGGGQGKAFLYCEGCGQQAISYSDGQVDWLDRHEKIFEHQKTTI